MQEREAKGKKIFLFLGMRTRKKYPPKGYPS
jgi:hypothetical protein